MTLAPDVNERNENEINETNDANETAAAACPNDVEAAQPATDAAADSTQPAQTAADASPENDNDGGDGDTSPAQAVEQPAEKPNVVYRWTYVGQQEAADKAAAKKNNGLGVYIALVGAMFAVCLLILAIVLAIGGKATVANYVAGDGTRVVFVRDGENQDLPKTPEEIALGVSPSVVGVRSSLSGGTVCEGAGIILTEDGYILTNYHVVQDATTVIVYLYGGYGQGQDEFYRAKLVGAKPEYDLAVLKIEESGLMAAAFADSDGVLIGDTVYAVGHPGGLDFGWTFSDGVVSGVNRVVTNEYKYSTEVIQSNVTVNTGNSGGPLLNDAGEVIGVVTMRLSGNYQGMNFALPSNIALAAAQDIMENGGTTDEADVINRPYVGITGCTAMSGVWMFYNEETGSIYTITDEEHATLLGATYISHSGVWVISVMEDSGAYGRLQAGDIIIALDGVDIYTMDNMIELISCYSAGDDVFIRYIRDGEERETVVRLTEQTR